MRPSFFKSEKIRKIRAISAAFSLIAGMALTACGGDGGGGNETVNLPLTDGNPKPTVSGTPDSYYVGPKSLEKYVVKFVDDAKRQGVDVLSHMKNPTLELRIMDLGAWSSSTIGLCESSRTRRRLTVDPDFWNKATEERRELLMHHELGHCVLNRRHRSGTLSNGNLVSLMGPKIMSGKTYLANYDYYQAELFDKNRIGWTVSSSTTLAGEGDADLDADKDLEVTDVCDAGDLD